MFNPVDNSPLQNLAALCQATETYLANAGQVESAMMDTAAPSAARVISGTGAITLFPNAQAQTAFAGPWSESVSPPLTLSGTISPGPGQLDSHVESADDALLPGPGSVFLALGAVATLAAFRLHEGFRE